MLLLLHCEHECVGALKSRDLTSRNLTTRHHVAMSTLAIWCRVVRSCDVSHDNIDGLAMSGLAFSVALNVYT